MRAIPVLLLTLLAGCATRTPADLQAWCQSFGYKPNTPELSKCMMNEDLAYEVPPAPMETK